MSDSHDAVPVGPQSASPPMVAQSHGGAIFRGGVPGHRGGNQHTVGRALPDDVIADLEDELRALVGDLRGLAGEARAGQTRCTRCGAFGPSVSKLSFSQLLNGVERIARLVEHRAGPQEANSGFQVNVYVGGKVVQSY